MQGAGVALSLAVAHAAAWGEIQVVTYRNGINGYAGQMDTALYVNAPDAFRGNQGTVYRGKIIRIAPTVKRMQRIEPDSATSTDARVVQVEIELDDPSSMPQVLGREKGA